MCGVILVCGVISVCVVLCQCVVVLFQCVWCYFSVVVLFQCGGVMSGPVECAASKDVLAVLGPMAAQVGGDRGR